MHHENSIPYKKDMTKRDELEPFTLCLLSALESDYHDKSFNLKLLMDFLHSECCGGTYFELQSKNLLLGCRDKDPVKLTLSLFPLSLSPPMDYDCRSCQSLYSPPQIMHSQEGNNCL
jgi:hypothetical protein